MKRILEIFLAIVLIASPAFGQQEEDNSANRFDFRGGVSRQRKPFDNQVCSLKNAKPRQDGTIQVRGGQLVYATIGSASTGSIEALHSYYNVDEGFIVYSVKREDGVNDKAYVTETSGTTTQLTGVDFGVGAHTSIVEYAGVIYFVNGQTMKYHDPAVPMAYVLSKVTYGEDQDPPTGDIAIAYADRMWVSDGGDLRWSNAGIVTGLPGVDFPTENYITLGDVGRPITAVISGQDFLVAFTRDSFHIMVGTPDDNGGPGDSFWQHYVDGVGTLSQRSVSVSNQTVYFYGSNKRVYAISGSGLTDIDPNDYMSEYLESPGNDSIEDVALHHRLDELWLYVPKRNTAIAGRVLVYFPALDAWTAYENINGNTFSWAVELDRFFVGAMSGGKIYEQGVGKNDYGTAISVEMISRHESLGPFRFNKRFRLANVQADIYPDDTLNISYSVNNGATFTAFPNGSTLTNSTVKSWGSEPWGTSPWGDFALSTGWARFDSSSTIKGRDIRIKLDGDLRAKTKILNYHIEGDIIERND